MKTLAAAAVATSNSVLEPFMRRYVIFTIFFAKAVCLFAQSGATDGAISGRISDTSGGLVSKAQVTATNLATGFSRQASANQRGDYELPLLPLGTYSLLVTKLGFAEILQQGITVQGSRTTIASFTLTPSPVAQTVEVKADVANVSNETQSRSTLPSESIANLPLTSRNLWAYAQYTPAVASSPNYGFGTPGLGFGGLLRRQFRVDGMDDSQRAGGSKLVMFPPGAIQEVNVLQGSLLPEYGSTLGGIVIQNTKSGTNEIHGDLLDLERRPGLIARPSLASFKPFQRRSTRAGSVGFPILKNKLWAYGNIEFDPQDTPTPITILPRNAAALGIPTAELGSTPISSRYSMGLFRADFRANEKNSGFLRFNYFQVPVEYNGAAALAPKSANNNYYDQDISAVLQWQTVISPLMLNEFRFGENRRYNYSNPISGNIGAVYAITGVATLNSNATAGQYFGERQHQIVDNVSNIHGAHSAKFGFEYENIENRLIDRNALTFTFGAPGVDSVTNLPNSVLQYLKTASGTTPVGYTQLTQQFGNNTADLSNHYLGVYVQDQWKLGAAFTLTYGLRYDLLFYPDLNSKAPLPQSRSIPQDLTNFSPRLGIAWQLSPNTTLRAGYSLLYDLTDLQFLGTVKRNDGSNLATYQLAGTAVGAPPFPSGFGSTPSIAAVTPNIAGFARDFRTYRSHQFNVLLDHDLGRGYSVQAGYIAVLGRDAPVFLQSNLGAVTGTLADGRPIFGGARPNPAFGQIQLVSSVGSSNYNGAYLNVVKRLSNGLSFSASYTYSHAINNNDASSDTLGAVSGFPSNPINLDFDRGNASDDIRNRFTLQGVYQPHFRLSGLAGVVVNGWMISPAILLNTGFPVNVVQGTDLNRDGVLNDRPLFQPRNSVSGPAFKTVDLRVSRTFPIYERFSLELIGQAQNLLNSTNAACNITGCTSAVVNNAAAPDFKRITSAYDSRQIEIGARFRF